MQPTATMAGPARCDFVASAESLAPATFRPWSPACREDERRRERMSLDPERTWCLSEVDIFADLSDDEMERMAEAAPMRTYPAGALLYTPQQQTETLFILKRGRVRIFRLSADGRALTTAILEPGTIFGEMVVVGQLMHDNFAEALDETVVCVMGRRDVQRLLLGDPRIATRISEILGRRLAELEQRLSDVVFKTVAQRVADALVTLSRERTLVRSPVVRVTHEQLASLAGTSRETATKVLGDLAEQGLISLGRGRIAVLDRDGLRRLVDRPDPAAR
ncbi:Crp/Fnr family transcriptional regulator [Nocardioides sp. GCM10027113]|uniref:Crp/Fnr family transcriptional regulator n=1 Tax=unclassified Nocardioides TaxID=2615069 RepID=UPI00361CDE2F